jgi:hypothetical protein
MTSQDKEELEQWLRQDGALSAPSGEKLLDCACQRLFQLRLELPAEAELQRLVNGALNGYFYDLYEQITVQLQPEVQTQLDQLLVVPPDRVVSPFESFKADATNPGVNNLEQEISKLKTCARSAFLSRRSVRFPGRCSRCSSAEVGMRKLARCASIRTSSATLYSRPLFTCGKQK